MPVTLKEKGKDDILDKKTITFKTASDEVKVRLEYQPTEPGEKMYIIETPVQADEVDKENNRIERKVFVREAKPIKVLYVEGYRRYEYHFLKTLLERESDRTKGNKSIDLKVLLLDADREFAAQDRTALAEFPDARGAEGLRRGDPRRRGPAAAGRQDDGASEGHCRVGDGPRRRPADDGRRALRPVLLQGLAAARRTADRRGCGSPAGRGEHRANAGLQARADAGGPAPSDLPLQADQEKNEEIWKHLREMYWWSDGYVPKRAAEVLAYHPDAKAPADKDRRASADKPERQALVVQQFVGAGRSMFFGFDESWRWGFREDQAHYNEFWIQTVRYLSGSRRDRVELQLDRETAYRRGEPIKMTVRFPDDAPPPNKEAPVKVLVERRDPSKGGEAAVRTVELSKIEGSRASYGAVLTQTPEGLYHFVLNEPQLPSPRPEADCKVLAPPGEMDQLRMNQTEMEHAAEKTHGKFYTIADADNVLKDLPVGRGCG